MAIIVTPKNKKEEKVLKAFLNSLEIGFHSEKDEDTALLKAMKEGKKSSLMNEAEKAQFLKRLKQAK
jgi:uncharacterized protein DUF2683